MEFKQLVVIVATALFILQAQSCTNGQQRPTPEPKQTIVKPQDEFELHELRNGSVITTALLDRKRGRVWIWTKLTDAKKTGGPESAFIEERVVPTPETTVTLQDLTK